MKKKKDVFKIKHKPEIAGFELLSKAYYKLCNELIEKGYSDNQIDSPPKDTQVLYIEHKGEVIAFILYYRTERNDCWICGAWVKEGLRGIGLYERLWKRLVAEVKKAGLYGIEACTHVKNIPMQRIYERQNRKAIFITYRFEIKK